jgi:hypothetical protein
MPNFSYYHVEIAKSDNANDVVIKGEISNNGDKSYSTVAVLVILFKKSVTVANIVFTINGLPAGSVRAFSKTIEELDYEQVGRDITRYDIYTETAF